MYKNIIKIVESYLGCEITKDRVLENIPNIIESVKLISDLTSDLKELTIKFLKSLNDCIKYGLPNTAHGIGDRELKMIINVLEVMGKSEARTESEKRIIEILAESCRQKIENRYRYSNRKY